MKLGIITWFNYENYGTKLQAVALQYYLRQQGYDAELIDFVVNDSTNKVKHQNPPFLKRIYGRISYDLKKIAFKKYASSFEERSKKFNSFIVEHCCLSRPIYSDKDYIEVCNQYDALIFGSDQIWNPNWMHPYYYADFDKINIPRISYAPSLGVADFPVELSSDMRNKLNRFQSLSVREKRGCQIVHALTGRQPQLVADPTLLLTSEDWERISGTTCSSDTDKRYILCYFLSDNQNHWKAARRYSKKRDLPLRVIPQTGFAYWQRNISLEASAGVEEFIDLIRNADCVITDSFHACVFSIIFKKPFAVFERFSSKNPVAQNTRIYNLLDITNTQNGLQKYDSKFIHDFARPVMRPSKSFSDLLDESKQYLIESIEKAEKFRKEQIQ